MTRSALRTATSTFLLFVFVVGCASSPGSLDASAVANASAATAAGPFADLESVRAFDALMAAVAEMRGMILADARDEREAAEGMRFILRTLAMGQEVSGDGHPLMPHFARMDTPRRKLGGDNPDAEYDNLVFDGRVDYRISGNRGTVDHLSFTVLSKLPNGRQRKLGYLNERDLELDADGSFTLWLTGDRPDAPGNWVETGEEAGVGSMLIRQYIGDRATERLATYEVEVVGREPGAPIPPSTDAEIAAGLRGTTNALRGLGWLHHYVSPSLGENPNAFKRSNSDDFGTDISSDDNLYMIGHYDFPADEALLVEVDPIDARYWNFAIENLWHQSVDYADRQSSRTHEDVTRDPDGRIRFVVAHAPVDHPNFLETAGHARGFMTFRWVGERDSQAPLPTVTKASVEEILRLARERGR